MSSHIVKNENIELSLPLNAAYVSAARLTAASIANRVGFDIDEIEDIKAAVSETCSYIIKQATESESGSFTLNFSIQNSRLDIIFATDLEIEPSLIETDMGLIMIKALSDNLEISKKSEKLFNICITKIHKEINFN